MSGRCRRGAVGLLLLVLVGCSTRDVLNPLDPRNPNTQGQPRWLEAFAANEAVDLQWDVPAFADLNQVVVRDLGTDDVLWQGGVGAGTLRHAPVQNGVLREYRLDLVLDTGVTLSLPVETARPGPEIAWVFDPGSGAVWRMTADGARPGLRVDAPEAAGLATDPATGAVLVLDFFRGAVRVLDADGTERWRDDDLFRPLAALPVADGWWVSDPGLGWLVGYHSDGVRDVVDSSFTFPVHLAPAVDGALWIADGAGGAMLYQPGVGVVGGDSTGFGFADLVSPAAEGTVWVYDSETDALIRMDAAGARLATVTGLAGVVDVAADPVVTDGVWYTDRPGRRVVLVDGNGGELTALDGFLSPASIAVSPDGSRLWIADPSAGDVSVVTREGVRLSRSVGVTQPVTVSVAFQPQG